MTDININNISEALNDKADADLENTIPQCIDYVIEYKIPTTEDPSWYRVYKSGWCEQGGKEAQVTADSIRTITLLKQFSTSINFGNVSYAYGNAGSWGNTIGIEVNQTTVRLISGHYGDTFTLNVFWEAKGFVK